jgi:primosomal protein N' (replication factor Y)
MIAKGHHFPGVTLVGVIAADETLNIPDYQSGERTFQLLSQVIGRAGRGDLPGKVLIQALETDNYAVRHAAEHDFEGFFTEELEFRREAGYPPFAYLATIVFSSNSQEAAVQGSVTAASLIWEIKRELRCRVEILGPVAPPLGKIRGRYRRQILLKSVRRTDLHKLLNLFRRRIKLPAVVRTAIDVDPVDML